MKKKHLSPPRFKTILDSFVPLQHIEDGILSLREGRRKIYRGILSIESLEYQLLSFIEQGALIANFKRLLNGLQAPIQILIRTQPADLSLIEPHPQTPSQEEYAQFLQTLLAQRTLVKRSFSVIVSDAHSHADRRHHSASLQEMQHRLEQLSGELGQLGLQTHKLDTFQAIQLLHSTLSQPEPPLTPGQLIPPEEPFASQWELADLLAPAAVSIGPYALQLSTETKQEYLRVYVCTHYPHRVSAGWLNRLIQIEEPSIEISLFFEPLPNDQVQQQLSRQAIEFRGSILFAERQEHAPDPITTHALSNVEKLRDKLLTGDERAFAVSLFVLIRASTSQTLEERSIRVQQVLRSLEIRALPLHYQHHLGWLSTLPYNKNMLPRYARLFSTSAASTFFPFTTLTPLMEQGVLFGVHPNGQLILVNPFDSSLPNANLSIFGQSGSGKSFFLKVILKRLADHSRIFILDPEGEYQQWGNQQQAQHLHLSAQSFHINPLELTLPNPLSEEERVLFLQEKLTNLMTFFSLLIGERQQLTQQEKATLYRCLLQAYERQEATLSPSLTQLISLLRLHSPLGQELAERLVAYTHLFPAQTTLSLHHSHGIFDLQLVPQSLKPIAFFVLTELLWNELRQQRTQGQQGQAIIPTIILLDEAWFLLENAEGAQFLSECARRIRKYGGGLWLATHRSGDFFHSEQGKTVLSLSSTRLLFHHDVSNLQEVSDVFRLSTGQQHFLQTAHKGEALLLLHTTTTQIEVVASPQEQKMANTTLVTEKSWTQKGNIHE